MPMSGLLLGEMTWRELGERIVTYSFPRSGSSREIALRIIPLDVSLQLVRLGRAAFVMQIALSPSGDVLLDYAGSRLADLNSLGLEFDHDPFERDTGIGSHDFGDDLA